MRLSRNLMTRNGTTPPWEVETARMIPGMMRGSRPSEPGAWNPPNVLVRARGGSKRFIGEGSAGLQARKAAA